MTKTKNLLFTVLAALIFAGSVIFTGCTSAEFWNTTAQVKIEKTFLVNVPELDYKITVKVRIEDNALYLTVAGLECEPIYLKEIFSEGDEVEFLFEKDKVKKVLIDGKGYSVIYETDRWR
jgi:hypothetical protein